MPRYFFDIHDGHEFIRDDDGIACEDFQRAREEAMKALPEIARFAIPKDGDHQGFAVLVRDEAQAVVYTATVTFTGLEMNSAKT